MTVLEDQLANAIEQVEDESVKFSHLAPLLK